MDNSNEVPVNEEYINKLKEKVKEYIMDDTTRKEDFTDIEICNMYDNDDANCELNKILESYSDQDFIDFVNEVINGDAEICEGGWRKVNADGIPEYFPKSSERAQAMNEFYQNRGR